MSLMMHAVTDEAPERSSSRNLSAIPESGVETVDVGNLFVRFKSYVASIGFALLGNAEEADDLVQEVFSVAIRSINQVRERDAIHGWLATIAVRTAKRRLRRRRLMNIAPWSPSFENMPGSSSDPEQALYLARVYTALDALPDNLREAWTLRYFEGATLEDVAKTCRCSLSTAKRRVAAAHVQVQRAASPWAL